MTGPPEGSTALKGDSAWSFCVVDDDHFIIELVSRFLEQAGHSVWTSTSSTSAFDEIVARRPTCVILDIMMPELDGLELCARLRAVPELSGTKLLICSSKAYEFDKQRARELGADGYIAKPISHDTFLNEVEAVIRDRINVRFWGVHGTLPVPGPHTVRYGGNTSCVSLNLSGERMFVFDAGSGIRELSAHLMAQRKRIAANIFISHPHWDHINALPFFAPLYVPGNQFDFYGAAHGSLGMRDLVAAQMNGVYFPITMREFGARLAFHDLREETLTISGVEISTMLLSHPGYCLGYRASYRGRSVCYVTDNELYLPTMPAYSVHYVNRLIEFVRGADLLITDTSFNDDAYPAKMNWGHSSVSQVLDLAHRGEVKTLCLFHHEPDQTDDDIDRKLEFATQSLAKRKSQTKVIAPAEGDSLFL
jgi:phosphoribosyl 1,2-cyclic phosphodiesterase